MTSHVQPGFTEFAEGVVRPLSYCPAWKTTDGVWHSLAEGIPSGSEYDRDAGIDPAHGGGSIIFKMATRMGESSADNELQETVSAVGSNIVMSTAEHDTRKASEQTKRETAEKAMLNTMENDFEITWTGPLPGMRSIITRYVQRADELVVTYIFEGEIEAVGAVIPLMYSDGREQAVITYTERSVRTTYLGAYVESTIQDAKAVIQLNPQEVASRNRRSSKRGWKFTMHSN